MLRALAAALLIATGAVVAQEGHPLTGTWTGDWGTSPDQRTRITLVMTWDGKAVTGTLNPGPNAVDVRNIVLNVDTWTVRLQVEGKDAAGTPVKIAANGEIEELGSWHRTLRGTWTQDGKKGTFRLTRD